MSRLFEALQRDATGAFKPIVAAITDIPAAAAPADVNGAAIPQPMLRTPARRVLPLRPNVPAVLPFEPGVSTHASEQYRIVRTRIVQHPLRPSLILVSSPDPGDGKTITAINIAGALALKSDGGVLLIDTDFRRPNIHEQLGIPIGPGMADLLAGECGLEDVLIRVEKLPNLSVITAGERRSNPAELLGSSMWPEFCAGLRKQFRHIVLDCAPIGAVADYDLVQAVCDGVVVVIRPDHTHRDLCKKALGTIPKEKLLGIVVNCVEDWFLGNRTSSYYYEQRRDH